MGNTESRKGLADLKSEEELDNVNKILLLGTGISGKSTFFKHLEILFSKFSSTSETSTRTRFIKVHSELEHLKTNIEILCAEADKQGIELLPENQTNRDLVLREDVVSEETWRLIYKIWRDPGIQKVCFEFRPSGLRENAEYFLDRLQEFTEHKSTKDEKLKEKDKGKRKKASSSSDEVFTLEDDLHASVRTSGLLSIEFELRKKNYRVTDTGGQRTERIKLKHCLDPYSGFEKRSFKKDADAGAILFFVSISQYDQYIYEDPSRNSIHESIDFWKQVLALFGKSRRQFVLVLCMFDIFQKKIKKVKLTTCFPEYDGSDDPEEAFEYIKLKYLSCAKDIRVSCVRANLFDKTDVEKVWTTVAETLTK